MALADYQRDIDIVEVSSSSLDMPTKIKQGFTSNLNSL